MSGLYVLRQRGIVNDHCDARQLCDQEGLDAAQSADRFSTVFWVTGASGLALVGAGLYFILTDKRGSATETALVPVFTPSAMGVSFVKSF
jgi:hypothetical protein